MIKLSYRENKDAKVKTDVTLDIEVDDLPDLFPRLWQSWLKYGFRVYCADLGRKGQLVNFLSPIDVDKVSMAFEVPVPPPGQDSKAKALLAALSAKGIDINRPIEDILADLA